MSIWNKILLGLILVASIALFVLSMRALRVHQYWRSVAVKLEQKQATLEKDQEELKGIADKSHGIRQAVIELHKVMMDRGRVWFNCAPKQVDVAGGAVKVRLAVDTLDSVADAGDVQQLPVKSVVYLFEGTELKNGAGGRYLGEFVVTAVAEKQADNPKELELQPTMKLSDGELKRLEASQQAQTPWIMYDIMPVDDHDIFTELSEPELKELLPAPSLADYEKDGKPSEANNPQSPAYERKLRDYEVLFRMYHMRQTILADEIAATTRDRDAMQAALDDAQNKQTPFCQAEIDRLKDELAQINRERDAVIEHLRTVQGKLADVVAARDQYIASNRAAAAELARAQAEDSRLIDQRSRTMAQSGPGQ